MIINEITHSPKNTPESNLVTALELIRNRYKDTKKAPTISTQSLINLVLNTDKTFDYDALVSAAENNSAVKNLIKSFNKDQVTLRHSEPDEVTTTVSPDTGEVTQNPVDTVDDMAKRAAKARGAAI